MNKTLLIITALTVSRCAQCPAVTIEEVNRLIPALIAVESRGNNLAIGDNGNAVGCLQIWPVLVKDVNRITGKAYTLKDRYSRKRSVEMCQAYLMHYGKGKTMEQAARIWNGGPKGDKKQATVEYWKKVEREMK